MLQHKVEHAIEEMCVKTAEIESVVEQLEWQPEVDTWMRQLCLISECKRKRRGEGGGRIWFRFRSLLYAVCVMSV